MAPDTRTRESTLVCLRRRARAVAIGAWMALEAAAFAFGPNTRKAQEGPPQTGTPGVSRAHAFAITHVNVVDVIEGRVLLDATVTINGTTIASVRRSGRLSPNTVVVDAGGGFLIPGLWDMHSHMEASGASWLPLYVANGVTGIRDMGSDLDTILNLREGTASGRLLGPRIFAAGPILDDAPADWPFRLRVKTAEDGTAAVRMLKRRGVDLIKVHNNTPRHAYFAIAAEARRQHLPLAGHVPVKVSVQEAIDAGQKDIEHFSESRLWMECSGGTTYRLDACQPLFTQLARRGIWQTPTIVALSEILRIGTPESSVSADNIAYATKSVRDLWAGNRGQATPAIVQLLEERAEISALVASDMAQSGVGILTGCDTMIAGFCIHDELEAMVRGGMTPLAALRAATSNPARYFGISETAGSIAAGRRADLVLLDRNPLNEISNVRHIRAVVSAGRFLNRDALDNLLTRAKSFRLAPAASDLPARHALRRR
jgi:Amidohydrolase family